MIKFRLKSKLNTVVYWIPELKDHCEVWWPDIHHDNGYTQNSDYTIYDLQTVKEQFEKGRWIKVHDFQDYLKQVELL